MPKVIITLISKSKLINIKATLNTKAKVSIISLNIVLRFKILIIYSIRIALYIIIKDKFKFIKFIDNIAIIIKNTIVRT
jgi:hypothetical protein